jgi:hypothetical protein
VLLLDLFFYLLLCFPPFLPPSLPPSLPPCPPSRLPHLYALEQLVVVVVGVRKVTWAIRRVLQGRSKKMGEGRIKRNDVR